MATNNLPTTPFDGQSFIDAYRIKWVYDGSTNCWKRIGAVPDIPLANELESGLLSAQFKQLIDGIPEKGGHFGIIARPLLNIPETRKVIVSDMVRNSFVTPSGSTIRSEFPFEIDRFIDSEYRHKLLMFTSGTLNGEIFLVFDNNDRDIFLNGDASKSKAGDTFDILELNSINPNSILSGDIELVSESIDISCIDANNNPIDIVEGKACQICDIGSETPPGLDFRLSERFIADFCVEIPGCIGPTGDKGAKGAAGKIGTGDGPQGEPGDPGEDAVDPSEFTDIIIEDIDDIFDTAVVSVELDAANNKLNIIKAKVRVPGNNDAASKVIASPIMRSLSFIDDNFKYELKLPQNDPIGTSDIQIAHYPQTFSPSSGQGNNVLTETQVGVIRLSEYIDRIIDFFKDKLLTISDQYDQEIRAVIEDKDAKSREILADLAQQLAECEWSQPLQFCLGIAPDDCQPNDLGTFPYPLAEPIAGSAWRNATATDMGTVKCNPGEGVPVTFPQGVPAASLPNHCAYVVQYFSGAIGDSTGFNVGDITGSGTKIQVEVTSPSGNSQIIDFPVPSAVFNNSSKQEVSQAYKDADFGEQALFIQFEPSINIANGGIIIRSIIGSGEDDPNGAVTFKLLKVSRQMLVGTAQEVRTSAAGELVTELLGTAIEGAQYSIEVTGTNVLVGGSILQSANLVLSDGGTINGAISVIPSPQVFSAVVQFGQLPLFSAGDAKIELIVDNGGPILQDFVPIRIGTVEA